MSSALEIKYLSKSYGSKIALDDLTISFPGGQITGLLGPNGAGKSTLLKVLVGLVKPQFGIIRIFDQPAHWKLNSEIAYLPDRPKWYKVHTVKQAITYAHNVCAKDLSWLLIISPFSIALGALIVIITRSHWAPASSLSLAGVGFGLLINLNVAKAFGISPLSKLSTRHLEQGYFLSVSGNNFFPTLLISLTISALLFAFSVYVLKYHVEV